MFRKRKKYRSSLLLPDNGAAKRTDRIILCLCLAVLALLVARTFLPKASETPHKAASVPIRHSVPPEAVPSNDTKEQIHATDAMAPAEKVMAFAPPAALSVPLRVPTLPADPMPPLADADTQITPLALPLAPAPGVVLADAADAAETGRAAEPSVPPAADLQPPGPVYSAQVASFKSLERADQMAARIRKMGFQPSVIKLKDSAGAIWYVVQIGDWTRRRDALRAAARYQAAGGAKATVVSLDPVLLAERKIGPAPSETAPEAVRPQALPDGNPMNLVRRGAYRQAAAVWQKDMDDQKDLFSVKLEVDCLEESVLTAFTQGDFDGRMYVLPMNLEGKSCYLVLWGRYRTEAAAVAALPTVPPFFSNQADPPRPVRLGDYLRSP